MISSAMTNMAYPVDLAVDTSALVAILLNEPDGSMYSKHIASSQAVLSAVGKVETLMVVLSRAPDEGRERFDFLLERLGIVIVGVDDRLAELAISAFLRYGKGRHPAKLNFGDCFSYALAKRFNVPLLFKGNDFSQSDIHSAIKP